jgi:hypothetical protein
MHAFPCPPHPPSSPIPQAARQLALIAAILQRVPAAASDPWALLELGAGPRPPAAGAAAAALHQQGPRGEGDAARLFRRLAAAAHPDKALDPAWAGAAGAAFRALSDARDAAMAAGGKQRGSGGAGGADEDGMDWADTGADWAGADTDAAWWEEWDAAEEPGGARGPAFPDTQPREADWEAEAAELSALSLDALRAEVARRQAAVLVPATAEERALPPAARQRRLRVARGVLSARLEAAEEAAAGGGGDDVFGDGGGGGGLGGGFLPEGPGAHGLSRKKLRVEGQEMMM